jgi:hypothetical protein
MKKALIRVLAGRFSCAGTNSNGIINGSRSFDFMYGRGGDDVLYGNHGGDEIPKPKRR